MLLIGMVCYNLVHHLNRGVLKTAEEGVARLKTLRLRVPAIPAIYREMTASRLIHDRSRPASLNAHRVMMQPACSNARCGFRTRSDPRTWRRAPDRAASGSQGSPGSDPASPRTPHRADVSRTRRLPRAPGARRRSRRSAAATRAPRPHSARSPERRRSCAPRAAEWLVCTENLRKTVA